MLPQTGADKNEKTSATSNVEASSKDEAPTAAIVAGAMGGVVALLLIVGASVYFLRKKKAGSSRSDANVQISHTADSPDKI